MVICSLFSVYNIKIHLEIPFCRQMSEILLNYIVSHVYEFLIFFFFIYLTETMIIDNIKFYFITFEVLFVLSYHPFECQFLCLLILYLFFLFFFVFFFHFKNFSLLILLFACYFVCLGFGVCYWPEIVVVVCHH